MKRYSKLAICCGLVIFFYCHKDTGVVSNTLIGTWQVKEIQTEAFGITLEASNIDGIIIFEVGGIGREDYSYEIAGRVVKESNSFTWRSTEEHLFFDEATADATTWERLINTAKQQKGRFLNSTDHTSITISVEKLE